MADFSKYKLHFGYTGGRFGEVPNGLDCTLSDFGELIGSIGLGGKRRSLPGYIESDSRPEEDYCMLLLPESPATRGCKVDLEKLEFLPCGRGEYLRRKTEDSLLGIFGHPGADEVPPPLRVSFGAEKYVGNTDPEHHIFYDVDTLGGNSGSPVFGRGSDGGGYEVKAIHIRGDNGAGLNSGQGFMHIKEWTRKLEIETEEYSSLLGKEAPNVEEAKRLKQ